MKLYVCREGTETVVSNGEPTLEELIIKYLSVYLGSNDISKILAGETVAGYRVCINDENVVVYKSETEIIPGYIWNASTTTETEVYTIQPIYMNSPLSSPCLPVIRTVEVSPNIARDIFNAIKTRKHVPMSDESKARLGVE